MQPRELLGTLDVLDRLFHTGYYVLYKSTAWKRTEEWPAEAALLLHAQALGLPANCLSWFSLLQPNPGTSAILVFYGPG